MKLKSLLEIEYGSQNLLQTYQSQIKDIDPSWYRDLQTMMSRNPPQDNNVDKEIRAALESGKLEYIADLPPDDKAITPTFRGKAVPFQEHTITFTKDDMATLHNTGELVKADKDGKDHTYKFNELKEYYVDAVNEDEAYCPSCANKLKEIVKKSVAECWKTHKQVGMKKKGDKTVPNCVPKNEVSGWDGSASKDPGMWDGKPSEKDKNFPAVGEAKTKPAKGKRFAKKVKNKKTGRTRTVSYGQAGKAKKGGDRIRPGTKKGHAYCARSAKIKKCKNPPCANALSRKKWKCQGSRSVK